MGDTVVGELRVYNNNVKNIYILVNKKYIYTHLKKRILTNAV